MFYCLVFLSCVFLIWHHSKYVDVYDVDESEKCCESKNCKIFYFMTKETFDLHKLISTKVDRGLPLKDAVNYDDILGGFSVF